MRKTRRLSVLLGAFLLALCLAPSVPASVLLVGGELNGNNVSVSYGGTDVPEVNIELEFFNTLPVRIDLEDSFDEGPRDLIIDAFNTNSLQWFDFNVEIEHAENGMFFNPPFDVTAHTSSISDRQEESNMLWYMFGFPEQSGISINGSYTKVAAAVDGFSLYIYPNAVPIPAALWLFGSGLLGLIGVSRRKKPA